MKNRVAVVFAVLTVVTACRDVTAPQPDAVSPSVPAFSHGTEAVYQYRGNPFTSFSCGGTAFCATPAPTNSFTSFTATDFVSATLTLADPLPAEASALDVTSFSGFQLTLRDGHQTLTVSGPGNGVDLYVVALVSTNAAGQITEWRFVITTIDGAQVRNIQTENGIANYSSDTALLSYPTAFFPNTPIDLAFNENNPGSWSSGTSTPPTPAAAVTNLINTLSNPALGLTPGQTSSLTEKLTEILTSIQTGSYDEAVNQLEAWIDWVAKKAQKGEIDAQTAATLIAAANAIIASLTP